MKRIDDKIKEIEKKDKNSRVLYIIIVLLITGFMAYALSSEKKIKAQGDTIEGQSNTIAQQNDSLINVNKQLEETISKLKKSLTPQAYWDATVKAATTKSYIDYITHSGNIEILFRDEAIENIKTAKGKSGWLFCGRVDGNKFTESIIDIIWRKGEENDYKNAIPTEGDIVILKGRSRRLYSNTSQSRLKADWAEKTKGVVVDKKLEGNALFLKIKL